MDTQLKSPTTAVKQNGSVLSEAIVRVEDVFKIYREGPIETVALKGASLTMETGDFLAILGRSGSGKSTLMHLIAGLDLPSAGRVIVGSSDMSRLDPESRARVRRTELGIVLQFGNLLPFFSARENVELPLLVDGVPPEKARARADELLDLVGLGQRTRHRTGQLSGGEEQRVAIACALANQPRLVLADEITGELDTATARTILDLLAKINVETGTAFLMITHSDEVANRAKRVVTMLDGQVRERDAA